MADTSETAAEAPQLTFKVRSSGDRNHQITMPETAKVIDLKNKLSGSEFEGIPADRQRLIYSGRVMKNDDALSVYKIKNNNTIHLVKSAASNPAPAAASSSAPTPQAIPQNMSAGTLPSNLLAGLTGARFAGHANLPGRDLFGADGGMGAPPTEEQVAEMLSNPAIAQTMNEALNNPAFIDTMIQANPMLANMPNAREMLQSPYFRNMMTNPEAIRAAARMRRMMQGGQLGGGSAFPAPGVTDTTPDAGASGGAAGGPGQVPPPLPGMNDLFGPDAFRNLFGNPPPTSTTGAAAAGGGTAGASAGSTPGAQSQGSHPGQPPANPFAALFGGAPHANLQNPFGMSPEEMQRLTEIFGSGASPAAPADNRPPEERYAEQLRQLNDMGFYDFDRNIAALRRSGGSVQGAIEHLLNAL